MLPSVSSEWNIARYLVPAYFQIPTLSKIIPKGYVSYGVLYAIS